MLSVSFLIVMLRVSMPNVVILKLFILNVIYAECHIFNCYAECQYVECHIFNCYAECQYVECPLCFVFFMTIMAFLIVRLNVVILSVVMLNVVAPKSSIDFFKRPPVKSAKEFPDSTKWQDSSR
jgi:hypothetical protein